VALARGAVPIRSGERLGQDRVFLEFQSPERWTKVKRIVDAQANPQEDDEPSPGVTPWKGSASS
jgi:hypothetical protein